ncbi:MAG: amino acid adenylation domain-containing protein [Deltaproteobacteria bacterium]|nr:amino acid adenylation domain-containing protein [Deltaproteobacteria bacterium]
MSEGRLALCHPQRRVWFTEVLHPGTGVGNLAGCLHFPGTPAQLPVLLDAIDLVIRRHDALRLRLARTDGAGCEQLLVPHEAVDAPVWEVDASRRALLDESRRPFPLFGSPLHLFRLLLLPEGRIGYFFKYHHIVVDALTVSILNRQILDTFRALVAGASTPAVEAPSYLEFFERERQYLASPERREEEAFWRDHLAGLEVGDEAPRGAVSILTERFEHDFDPALSRAVEAFCKQHETTVFRFFLSVFAVHFAGGALDRDIVIGTGHHNRLTAREKAMVGMTVSTLPMRLPLREDDTFAHLVRRIHGVSDACLARQRYPYDLLAQHVRGGGVDPQRLLRWFVNFIPSVPGGADEPTVERYSPGADLAELNFKINPNQRPRTAPLQLCVDARSALYGEADVRTLFARVEMLARAVLARPDEPLHRLDRLTEAERLSLPSPRVLPPSPGTILQRIEEEARQHPDAVAVVDAAGSWTYGRLVTEARSLAAELVRRGVQRGDRVAVISERQAAFVVHALAVMGAGAAYVPITPDTPEHRRARILADAGITVVLTGETTWDRSAVLPGFEPVGPDDLAYVIYTSGSTGEPKGVMIPHRALANLCEWNARLSGVTSADRCAAYCSFMFDVSVGEVFTPLVRGASVYVVPSAVRGSVREVGRFFVENAITVATLPTRVGELFMAHGEAGSLRVLTVGGEKLRSPIRAQAPLSSAPGRPYRILNGYGPTEATVYATAYEVRGDESDVPIGTPADNTWAYVVDEHLRLVPPGEEGELLLAGDGIARGYLGKPELTRAAFVPNPFATGERDTIAYRTGDRVRWLPDGNLVYLGRRDRQLKLRGFRVEPEEIERCFAAHPAVERCVVLVREEGPERHLVACCVVGSADGGGADGGGADGGGADQVDVGNLRALAEARLPPFMVPAELLVVPALPLTPNGKTDTAALLALRGRSGAAAVAPRDDVERALLSLFQAVLKRDDLGVADAFFDSGGDSLRAMELFAEIERRFGGGLPVSALFQNPTVASLAGVVSRAEAVDNVVVMAGAEARDPLFVLHDFSGDLIAYTALLKHLDPRLGVRGIRWTPEVGADAASIEEVAGRYVDALRAAQPAGPYRLLGYSIGGTLAYEMARQLVGAGERVTFLGLLDTPNYARDESILGGLFQFVTKNLLIWFRAVSLTYTLAVVSGRVGGVPDWRRIRDMVRAQLRMRQLAMRYQPGPAPIDAVVIKSATRRLFLDDDLGWKDLVAGVTIRHVPGNHITMMTDAHAPALAGHLRELLPR